MEEHSFSVKRRNHSKSLHSPDREAANVTTVFGVPVHEFESIWRIVAEITSHPVDSEWHEHLEGTGQPLAWKREILTTLGSRKRSSWSALVSGVAASSSASSMNSLRRSASSAVSLSWKLDRWGH